MPGGPPPDFCATADFCRIKADLRIRCFLNNLTSHTSQKSTAISEQKPCSKKIMLYIGSDMIHQPECWKRWGLRFDTILRVQHRRDGSVDMYPNRRSVIDVSLEDREDLENEKVKKKLLEGVQKINQSCLEGATRILVHCGAGQNRSAAIIIAFLMTSSILEKKCDFEAARAAVVEANYCRDAKTLINTSFSRILISLQSPHRKRKRRHLRRTIESSDENSDNEL